MNRNGDRRRERVGERRERRREKEGRGAREREEGDTGRQGP